MRKLRQREPASTHGHSAVSGRDETHHKFSGSRTNILPHYLYTLKKTMQGLLILSSSVPKHSEWFTQTFFFFLNWVPFISVIRCFFIFHMGRRRAKGLSLCSVGGELGRQAALAALPLLTLAIPEFLLSSLKLGKGRGRPDKFLALKRVPHFLSSGNFIIRLSMSLS